ncbi:MAG: 30S ribosomal protein S8 [Candidatus Babeliales bacterium]|nr:30S ribosomal protein S8 [Candidatus Babeliales bacterium]
MSIDTMGNFLTIIRNGIMVSKSTVTIPHSNLKYEVAKILKSEGFIRDVIVENIDSTKKNIKIFLKYVENESVIHEITRVSRPGKRAYAGMNEFKPVIGGLGVSVVTTSGGVMTDKRAKSLSLGGEILCTVW